MRGRLIYMGKYLTPRQWGKCIGCVAYMYYYVMGNPAHSYVGSPSGFPDAWGEVVVVVVVGGGGGGAGEGRWVGGVAGEGRWGGGGGGGRGRMGCTTNVLAFLLPFLLGMSQRLYSEGGCQISTPLPFLQQKPPISSE